ncbi:GGDEF domain-containing protein [uncultured Enterobacter sp.]|uniref:GGDEF domain-containing protein n=1 Tax=uncultured Enterobacter sp. TaxID=238202 RepID=UPI00260CCBBB|nr:GGDEF domain-containing protein [uncultured Enterobacter sp.]
MKNTKFTSLNMIAVFCFSVAMVVLYSVYTVHKENTSGIAKITNLLEKEQYVNDSLASILSSALDEDGDRCIPENLNGAVYLNGSKKAPCTLIDKLSVVEGELSDTTKKNRYISFKSLGFVYFFNKAVYDNLKPEQYNDVMSLTGRYKNFQLNNKKPDLWDFWNAHVNLNEVYIDKVSHKKIMTMSSPVINLQKSQIIGAVYADISEVEIRKLIEEIAPIKHWIDIQIYNQPHGVFFCATDKCDNANSSLNVNIGDTIFANSFHISSRVNLLLFIIDNAWQIISLMLFPLIFNSIWLRIAREISKYKKESLTDPLTNVYNRSALNYFKKNEFRSLVIFDCNAFKPINDTYGHLVGDEVLKLIAKHLLSNVRKGDVVIRFGGDEFIILCMDDALNCTKMAERISNGIKKSQLHIGNKHIETSVSFGVASINDDIKKSLHDADKELYYQKNKKKNI